MFDELKFMDIALKEAEKGYEKNFVPVGAVITLNNKIISKAYNQDFWHAEILAIYKAQKKIGKYLNGCNIYVTLEPCPMCMHLIKLSQIDKIFFSTKYFKEYPLKNIETIEIYRTESTNLLKKFFVNLRNK